MKYTDEHKKQLSDFVKDGLTRVAFYMETTMGFPVEMFEEEIAKYKTLGEQIGFLSHFAKRHPKVFEGMQTFVQ